MHKQRRTSRRVPLSGNVTLTRGSVQLLATLSDISPEGLSVTVLKAHNLSVDSCVTVRFACPYSQEVVEFESCVRYAIGARLGLQIFSATDVMRLKLKNLVSAALIQQALCYDRSGHLVYAQFGST